MSVRLLPFSSLTMSCGVQSIPNEECSLGQPVKTAADGSVPQRAEACLNDVLLAASTLHHESTVEVTQDVSHTIKPAVH